MSDVYVIGSSSTAFQRWPDKDFEALTKEVYEGVLADAGLDDGHAIEQTWFGNCAMNAWGQSNIRGQVCLDPLIREGLHSQGTAIINVDGGCATGSMAMHGAYKDIRSGEHDLVLAMGVEKTFIPDDPQLVLEIFEHGANRLRPEQWLTEYQDAADEMQLAFEPNPLRVVFIDTYALHARRHMQRFGTTEVQIAYSAAKNHTLGALNDKAQYRVEMTIEEVLNDKMILEPFTRSMCSPISDGAAAVLLCSEARLATLPAETQERAIKVAASVLSGGRHRGIDEPGLSKAAATRAYQRAGLTPDDVDVVELHDSTSFCEIYQLEMLGFCEEGQGGPYVEAGETQLDGKTPVNPSGGLVSKGHPLSATGLGMVDELVLQLRGEAGVRQVADASVGLQQNAGGLVSLDEAACSVMLLTR